MKFAKLKKNIFTVSPSSLSKIKLSSVIVLSLVTLYFVAPQFMAVLGALAVIVGVPLLMLAAMMFVVIKICILLDSGGHWSDQYDTFCG